MTLVLGALSGPTKPAGVTPVPLVQIVLALSEQQRRRCDRRRFQGRSIRFLDVGTLAVRYESAQFGSRHVHPAQLQAVAPPGMSFGYDVMAEVLRLRYVELKQREQIRADLMARRVSISVGSVTKQSQLALGCLEQLHEAAAGALSRRVRVPY